MIIEGAPTDNSYSPPKAPVRDLALEIPGDVLKKIKHGWIAAVVSAAITLFFVLMAMSGIEIFNFSAFDLIEIGFMFGLAYGIYRKSRTCAVLNLVCFVLSKIFIVSEGGRLSSAIIGGIVFAYFYVQAIVGTFTYHKLLKQARTVRGHG
jgi:hypothetical protein